MCKKALYLILSHCGTFFLLTKLHKLEPPEQCEGGRRILRACLLSDMGGGGGGCFQGPQGASLQAKTALMTLKACSSPSISLGAF